MKTTLPKVAGMNGAQCVRLVINAIRDLPDGEASIGHGPMVSEPDMRQAIPDAGFDVA